MNPAKVAFALLCASPIALRAGDQPPDPRPDLEAAQAVLDQAVAEVSRPSVHMVLGGREAARGYRLKGVGAIFVLPPRALPNPDRERDHVLVFGDPNARTTIVRRHSRDRQREMQQMQIQVETLQREAEAQQREAERAFEEFEQNLNRLVAAPAPPPPAPPVAPAPPIAPSAPTLPPPPPWASWFETGELFDDRTPDRVIADVQAAVTSALESLGPRLRTLSADEAVLVAVDFLPSRGFEFDVPSAPARSLIVKARKRDLVDHSAGKISAEELRGRIEVTQY